MTHGIYIIKHSVYGPEPRSSGGNISSNPQVSALIPRPACNGMERMCQRHESNYTPIQSENHYIINLYIAPYAVDDVLVLFISNSVISISNFLGYFSSAFRHDSLRIKTDRIKLKDIHSVAFQKHWKIPAVMRANNAPQRIHNSVWGGAFNLYLDLFPKGQPTYTRQVVNPRHQTPQGQSVAKPGTPL